ncbi:universal stress protein [Ferruginivarius sediminum]|uniref:Universal stress protein n=1 Tax=Ferruginivarius sediminum TaxID=2661937 RepID=A0A369TFI0_9PROT|nr:universal stress protein [Ferruginivarius sediminum]RDD63354.1 universal stress protein [Ferruginivarius sediminum]
MSEAEREPADNGEPPRKTNRVFLVIVDETEEMLVALRFACGRARHTGGRVALLYVMEPNDFQHWMGVGDLMREEARTNAEKLLQRHAARVQEWSGAMPILYLREGSQRDALLDLIEEEPEISILVLGAHPGQGGPGPLVSALTGKLMDKLRIPITVVPGNLSQEDVDAIS